MKRILFALLVMLFSLPACGLYAQQNNQEEEDPEETAIKMAESLEKDLKLNSVQMFLVDSIFRHNFVAMVDESKKMQKMGVTDPKNYKAMSDKWTDRNLEALKAVLDEQQYIRYLKLIGKGKEYKKGKDGKYVLKKKKKE